LHVNKRLMYLDVGYAAHLRNKGADGTLACRIICAV